VAGDSPHGFSDSIIEADSYLPQLDEGTREDVVALLNSRLHSSVRSYDLFGLVLVMLGIRPACIVCSSHAAISAHKAAEMAVDYAAVTTWDPAGQFFDVYDIPFALSTTHSKEHHGDPKQTHLNYHISFDTDRLEQYEENHIPSEPETSKPTRADKEALGQFLDYPEPAIQAFCDDEQMAEGHLLDELSDEELQEAFGPLCNIYASSDLDLREFTRMILPYVVAATAPECLDRMVKDSARFIAGGVVAHSEYGITLFGQVIANYEEYYSPES